jgi:hypothetical protein
MCDAFRISAVKPATTYIDVNNASIPKTKVGTKATPLQLS